MQRLCTSFLTILFYFPNDLLWYRVCPSLWRFFRPSGFSLGILFLVFSKFWHGAINPYEVMRDTAGFWKIALPQKLGKWTKNGPKIGYFGFIEKFVIDFYWICSHYIVWCVPAQISYLAKILFLIYGSKCSQLVRLQDFLIINHISWANQWNSLIFCMLIQIHIN